MPTTDLPPQLPPRRKSRHAQIVRDLGLNIVSGFYKPGERLPAELDLCARYVVSRPVLREAFKVLVAKGLIVSRQKTGAIVRPRGEWHILDPDVLYWVTQTMPEQRFVDMLLTTRKVFEPAIAALAAVVATDEQLHAIRDAYEGMAQAATPQDSLEPDLAFHQLIAEATGNDLLAYISKMLSLALRETIKVAHTHPEPQKVSLPRHKAILTALQNRDALAARQATLVQLASAGDELDEVFTRAATSAQPAEPQSSGNSARPFVAI